MLVKFESLTLTNFKNHQHIEVNFGALTEIVGRNGTGKSTIGDGPTWVLFGTDSLGSKLDPTPLINWNGEDEPEAHLLLTIDDKLVKFSRSVKDGTAKLKINDVPKKAKEYEGFIAELFPRNLFLSLYNPTFFFTENWKDQRELVLQFIPEPLNAEVLEKMSALAQTEFAPELKKRELDDIEKINKDKAKDSDKAWIATDAKMKAYEEQIKEIDEQLAGVDLDAIRKRQDEIHAKIKDLRQQGGERRESDFKRANKIGRLGFLKEVITVERGNFDSLKELYSNIGDTPKCQTCGQAIPAEQVEQHRKAELEKQRQRVLELAKEYKVVEAEFAELPESNVQTDYDTEIETLREELKELLHLTEATEHREKLQITKTQIHKEFSLKYGNPDGLSPLKIMEYVKEFRAKKAELMAEKLGGLFSTLSIRLENEHKNGNRDVTFEVQMNGKPYSKLSTGQKIRAGLEMIDVLRKQSELKVPVFVDNAESVTGIIFSNSPQSIFVKALDSDLKITVE